MLGEENPDIAVVCDGAFTSYRDWMPIVSQVQFMLPSENRFARHCARRRRSFPTERRGALRAPEELQGYTPAANTEAVVMQFAPKKRVNESSAHWYYKPSTHQVRMEAS